ncbi:antibiotic biosynthesis monooxygenase [Kitasatospora sp. NBC_01287]|uniref:antibiotic biosynthesis monooxygenase family protein n=1 Tax=Kitasatospora sp. NBC_01287 TaxID=2903573 RepID=UPI002256AB3B|nr:antibiotic biosynthesis monooxygenase [Kitasatospora sp. NBC_01287]MCX4744573.1 antibiotic biosynthesis monooxygenase [Kitasatospora sp. NBC_01287]
MIIRIWEAQVAPRMMSDFCAVIQSEMLPELNGLDGYLGGELLRSLPDSAHRVLVVTRWRDEPALRAYAGPMWAMRPVWSENELTYLEHPPEVRHYTVVSTN